MCAYIGRFTKLLNATEDVSIDRAIDAFSDGVRRESYIEELGRKKLKIITKRMEIANSWADAKTTYGNRIRAVTTKRMIRSTIWVNDVTVAKRGVTVGTRPLVTPTSLLRNILIDVMTDMMIDEATNDDHRDGNRSRFGGSRGNYRERPPRVPELPFPEQLNAPCYIHACIHRPEG
jgi:hypothetical protein